MSLELMPYTNSATEAVTEWGKKINRNRCHFRTVPRLSSQYFGEQSGEVLHAVVSPQNLPGIFRVIRAFRTNRGGN
jgi:hypothetical protein